MRRWATQIKAWGKPLMLRFAHEMNGDWYPWSEGVNGNGAGQYVAAYRRVVTLFRSVGATNVTWVWSPNVAYPGSVPLSRLFPGDGYVDRTGLDGYNWAPPTRRGGRASSRCSGRPSRRCGRCRRSR